MTYRSDTPSTETTAIAERIADVSTPLETVDPARPLDDVRPLRDVLEDAVIVGLGESTHGTREFIRMKHRLLKLLLEEFGCRVFAIEASFSEAVAINEYVVHGNGRPRDIRDALSYWMYDSEAMLSVFSWARDYNEGVPPSEKIRFYGFDIGSERATDAAGRTLRRYFREVDPQALTTFREPLDMLVGDDSDATTGIADRLDLIPDFADEVGTLLADRKTAYSAATSERRWELVTRSLRELQQLYEANRGDPPNANQNVGGLRDQFMAENVSWILDYEAADRIALWSHNGHIMNACRDDAGPVMGRYLADEYGDAYYPLALTFGYGSFRATATSDGRRRQFTLEKPVERTLPAALAATGRSLFALSFETALADPTLRTYFTEPRPIHEIGSNFDPDRKQTSYYYPVVPATAFDGLVFVEESSPSIPPGEA